jgi:cobalt-zinc-cadmium efflux system protein
LGHNHASPGLAGRNNPAATRRLGLVLGITAGYAMAELVGGWLSNSLALLADAGHMLTDIMALALAWLAAWTARRPPDPSRTYGYKRVEILAALFNGVALVVIALFIFLEAAKRFTNPPEVAFGLMAAVAAGGLVVNIVGARLLHGHQHGMNVRAAYLHVLGDLLGSIGTLVAAAAIGLFGWYWADPAISIVIGAVIVFGAIRLVLDSVNVLLEGAPAHLNTEEVRVCLTGLEGVADVHDLHLWSLGGTDTPLLSAHLLMDGTLTSDRVLRRATRELRERFGIDHATLQLEPPDYNVIQQLTSVGED